MRRFVTFESALVRTVCRVSHRLRQDVVSPQFSRMLQLLFRRILRRYVDPRGAASLAARHSGLPRSNLRLPEGFRVFTPLTTGERRLVSIRPALPPFGPVSRHPRGLRWPAVSGSTSRVTVDCSSVSQRCSSPTPMWFASRMTGWALLPRLPSLRFHITSTVPASGRFVAVSPQLRSTFRRLEFKGFSPERAHVPGRVSHR